jgi:carbonic anhydrase
MSIQAIMAELVAGNARFVAANSSKCSVASLSKLKASAEKGQTPKAIILCCSDSRAPVEFIFDQDIGDLFVIRVAGNIVAPSLIGSIEFAVSAFGTKLIIVMGHTQCGAIKATLDHIHNPQTISSENIHDIISRIKPNIYAATHMGNLSEEEKLSEAVALNVRASVNQISHASRLIENLVLANDIIILGAVFDLATGQVNFLNVD